MSNLAALRMQLQSSEPMPRQQISSIFSEQNRTTATRSLGATQVLLAILLLLTFGNTTGCAKRIGDSCQMHTECSINADRICDNSQFEGYCTVLNCDPDRCPDNSLCIEFLAQDPRLARRSCMKTCTQNSDCRNGYECRTDTIQSDGVCPAGNPTSGEPAPVCNRVLDTPGVRPTTMGYCVQVNNAL